MALNHALLDSTEMKVGVPRAYAWVIFALTFGLLISDYMSRQVLNAVFPMLKSEWVLSDYQLGLLSSIVALMVGLLTFPLSLLADRWGRIKCLVGMATLWSLATLGCAWAENYNQMFAARFLVGVGEAAYGSVGIAVVVSVFPKHMRATLSGAFMAGGMFGSVLGVGLGGVLATHLGWRGAFTGMALFGLTLAFIYPIIVSEKRINSQPTSIKNSTGSCKIQLRSLFNSRSVLCAYIGSGLQLFVAGTMMVWMPSYLGRYYDMGTDKAGAFAAIVLLCSGLGMIFCGVASDRLANSPSRKISFAIVYCLLSSGILLLAFSLSPGPLQLTLICFGMIFAAGISGPASAMVANLTHPAIHATAFATLTLANNLIGLAPGPFVTGKISDHIGLHASFQLVALVSIAAAAVFYYARRSYLSDMQKLEDSSELSHGSSQPIGNNVQEERA
ncbi:MFS transporter [Photobacterium sp. TY1-4]|uniref:MFS transporter n=1 Tax=Photobacterium sp. TY1-4 TaxID=2899122 RepID=UPI0021C0378E|nr:MFS transporter [Photobacterium sp. TY1-4]UXI04462.1 MFS transporter [Photobacterium sp. TY1-4]